MSQTLVIRPQNMWDVEQTHRPVGFNAWDFNHEDEKEKFILENKDLLKAFFPLHIQFAPVERENHFMSLVVSFLI